MPLQEERLMVVFMLRVVVMLHQQTRVLLIHQLQNLLRKLNLRRHVAGRAEVCHVVRCCSVSSCSVML
jgi:hypothetical protein